MNPLEILPLLGQADSVYGVEGGELPDGAAAAFAAFMAAYAVVMIGLAVFFIICFWKIFTKAGKPGWASLIPIYNLVVYLEIVGRPIWWLVWFLIPSFELHHCDRFRHHHHHRSGQVVRERRGICRGPAFPFTDILSDPRLRQRAIPRSSRRPGRGCTRCLMSTK